MATLFQNVMRRVSKRLLQRISLAVLTSCACSALGQGNIKARYGNWLLRCETLRTSPTERCVLTQTIMSDDKPDVGLSVIVLKPQGAENGVIQVLAPLQVLLPQGVGLTIDQTDLGPAGFFKCLPAGCIAQIAISDRLLEQLRTGKIATLVIYMNPYEGLRHLLNLEGFKDGYNKL